MKRVTSLLTLGTLIFSGAAFAADGDIFVETDGVVMIEVESSTPASGWTQKTDLPDFKGSSYFEWTGPNHFPASAAGNGAVTYHFRITTPGNYQMRWRSRIAKGDSNTEHNDSWVRLATGQNIDGEHPLSGWTKSYMNRQNEWSWDSKTVDHVGNPIRQYFSAGDHTVEISGRSNGHAIDRIALYRYEDVSFGVVKFDGIAASNTTDGSSQPSTPTEPAPPESDWSTSAVTQEAGSCEGNVISLAPTADLYLQNNIVTDNDELKINDTNRTTLMQFDLSVVPRPLVSASLVFSLGNDEGSGPIIVSSGDHSDWSERDTGFNRPDSSILLGSFAGNWQTGEHYALPLDATLLGTAAETLILEMAAGSNDVSLKSRSTDAGPRLQLEGNNGVCDDYAALVAEAEMQQQETVAEPPAEPVDQTPVDETPADANPGNNEPGTDTTGNDEETPRDVSDIASDLGSAPILALLLAGFLRIRRVLGTTR